MASGTIGRGVRITFYGHAAFKLTGQGVTVVIDPWLSNPLLNTPVAEVGPVDVILVTLAQATGAQVVAIHELSQILAQAGAPNVIGMNKGGTLTLKDLKITMTTALHSSTAEVGGQTVSAGEAGGFVVTFPNGFAVYHAGDTAVFKDMEIIRDLYRPEVALLPIGSHYVMNPQEAALACRLLKPRFVIPMHYGTFPVLTGTPEELKALLKDQPEIQVLPLKPGESVD